MSDFIIPKGREYVFTVKILDKDSFLPRDLTTMTNIDVVFISRETNCPIDPGVNVITTNILDAINGLVQVTVPAEYTTLMLSERGDKVDGYYLKPTYKGVITVKFSDDSDVLSILDKVYVLPVSC